jgi:dephospho-CoA kinase
LNRSLTIGLTGGIGSGKSTVARIFESLGADVVSGDELGRIALESDQDLKQTIRQRFGESVFDEYGLVNRKELGRRVFQKREDAEWLTKATFHAIFRLWNEAVVKSDKRVIVFDAALIFEWGIERNFDMLAVVSAPSDKIIERSERFSTEELQQRLAAQIPPDVKRSQASVVIENSASLSELEARVKQIWNEYIVPRLESQKNK